MLPGNDEVVHLLVNWVGAGCVWKQEIMKLRGTKLYASAHMVCQGMFTCMMKTRTFYNEHVDEYFNIL